MKDAGVTTRDVRAPAAAPVVFGKPEIRTEEIEEILDSLRSAWLGTGPKAAAFERAVAEYVGVGSAVATNSCTAALHLALTALGIGKDDEVIVPTMTFCATANVVVHTGARPVLVDVDPDSRCLTPEAVEAAITRRTRAVVPVHFAGWPAPLPELWTLAERFGIRIVQDAAHCIDGRINGFSPSRFGHVTCFSFYATKNVVTGEGGMAVTDDDILADRMRVLGLHGLDADAWKRFSDAGYRHYDCIAPGFKYNMMDLQAALGIHQLARVEENLVRRELQWALYQEALADLPLELPAPAPPNIRHARHLYAILVRPEAPLDRDGVMRALERERIGSGVHYRPVHEHRYYRETFGYAPEDFPVAHRIGERTLSLPLGPGLAAEEQERVITALRACLT